MPKLAEGGRNPDAVVLRGGNVDKTYYDVYFVYGAEMWWPGLQCIQASYRSEFIRYLTEELGYKEANSTQDMERYEFVH